MQLPFPPYELAFIRGIPAQDGLPGRIWVNDEEINSTVIENECNIYCSSFTWGYSGSGPYNTAVAISYTIFGDKYLANNLATLI